MKRFFIGISIITLIANVFIAPPVSAQEQVCDEEFFSTNDILFWNPCDITCTPRIVGETAPTVANADYRGNAILTSAQLPILEKYKPTYEKAAQETSVPWQLIAAIHLRESLLSKVNPSTGEGIYGNEEKTGGPYTTGSVEINDEEFLRQSIAAANRLKSLADDQIKLINGDRTQIKLALFKYDGAQAKYTEQASRLQLGEGYEGSPYVMNKADLKRDPLANKTTWGQLDSKNNLTYPADSQYGTFVVYSALSGIASNGGCGGNLVEGGMNFEQARSFMEIYKDIDRGDPRGDSQYIKGKAITCKTGTDNCVAFSAYFVNKFTSLNSVSVNGRLVVSRMATANPGLEVGTKPRPYAIFSTEKGVTRCSDGRICGHTGVILGVDVEEDVVIVGEAQWCGPSLTRAKKYSLTEWSNGSYTYAYTDPYLKAEMTNTLSTGSEH